MTVSSTKLRNSLKIDSGSKGKRGDYCEMDGYCASNKCNGGIVYPAKGGAHFAGSCA